MSVLADSFLSPGTKKTVRNSEVSVKRGFTVIQGFFVFGLRFCFLNCIKTAMIIPPVRVCFVAVQLIVIERYQLHSMSLRANKIINICSESKSEIFLMICSGNSRLKIFLLYWLP